jgi:hypothetical protein
MTNNQIIVTILGGLDGGLVIYETVEGEQQLTFGGNLDEASKYLTNKMRSLVTEKDVEGPHDVREQVRLLEERAQHQKLGRGTDGNPPRQLEKLRSEP